jgi:hypothetical protein
MTDLIIRTGNAARLDETLMGLPGADAWVLPGSWKPDERTCVVRVEGDLGFFRFAMENQGYGEIVGEVGL